MQNRNWLILAAFGLAVFFVLSFVAMPFSGWGHSGWAHAGGWEMMRSGVEANNSMHGLTRGGWGFGPFGLLLGVVGMLLRLNVLVLLVFGGFLLWQRFSNSVTGSNDTLNGPSR